MAKREFVHSVDLLTSLFATPVTVCGYQGSGIPTLRKVPNTSAVHAEADSSSSKRPSGMSSFSF